MSTIVGPDVGMNAANLARSLEALELHHRVCCGALERQGRRLVLKSDGKGGHYLKFCRPGVLETIQAAFGKGNASLATIVTFCATHKIVSAALMGAVDKFLDRHGGKFSAQASRTKLGQQLVRERSKLRDIVEEMKREPLRDEERALLDSALDYVQSPSQSAISITEQDRCAFVARCAGTPKYLPIATALFRSMSPHERHVVLQMLVEKGKDAEAFDLLVTAKTHLPIETIDVVDAVLTHAELDQMDYYVVVRDILNEMLDFADSDVEKAFERFIEKRHHNLVQRLRSDESAHWPAGS